MAVGALRVAHRAGIGDRFSKTVVVLIRGAGSGELAEAPVLPRSRPNAIASSSRTLMMGGSSVPERRRIGASC